MFAFMVIDIVQKVQPIHWGPQFQGYTLCHNVEFSVAVDFLCRAVAAIIIGLLWFDGILYRDW